MPESASNPPQDTRAEHGMQLAMRFVALLRSARSYQLGNQVLTTQIDHFLGVAEGAFADHGELQLMDFEGDLHMNGARLPLRGANLKFLEQLQQEFHARAISGLVLVPGLKRAEFEAFMRFFLAADMLKGMELFHACETNGIERIFPAFLATEPAAAPDGNPLASHPGQADALATYHRALHLVEVFTHATQSSSGVELRHLKRIVQPLVDSALAGESTGTFPPQAEGRSTAGAHALQVALIAIQVGARLELDRRTLAEIGAGALLHDSGKHAVSNELSGPPEFWNEAQQAQARRHPIEGLKQIARNSSLNESSLSAMHIALEHHAFGPAAYPALPEGYVRSPLAEIVAIADAYVCLLESRTVSGDQATPSEALGTVLGPLACAFDPAVRAALVRAVGLYPQGQVVELDDGTIAMTHAADPASPERPRLEWLRGPAGVALQGDAPPTLLPLPADRRIVRSLPFRRTGH